MATDTTELAEIDDGDTGMIVAEPFNPTDARAHAVADTLTAAYARASTLELTRDESTQLAAPFPDEAFRRGAGGDDELIYIEHAYLRQRLNEVLGVGASVPIRRREWSEKFTYEFYDKYKKTKEIRNGVRVYVDLVLIVRGCIVGEAIGDSTYYPNNAKTNFSDALESAKSNAFRRCCKEFGIGLQAWMKGWGEGWKQRQANGTRQNDEREQASRNTPDARKQSPQANHAPASGTPGRTSPADMQSQADETFGPREAAGPTIAQQAMRKMFLAAIKKDPPEKMAELLDGLKVNMEGKLIDAGAFYELAVTALVKQGSFELAHKTHAIAHEGKWITDPALLSELYESILAAEKKVAEPVGAT